MNNDVYEMKLQHYKMQQQVAIIEDLGYKLNKKSRIVDLGCGNGNLVNEYRKFGYEAYGCDFHYKPGPNVANLSLNGIIRKIEGKNYRLPFEDNSIDFVVTDQVFEHVEDYSTTLSEIKRILKPNGFSLNFFPSRYKLIEPHVYIPLASINKSYYWLLIWAFLGVRKSSQKGLTARERAKENYKYLNSQTFYLTKKNIREHCKHYFNNVRFSEDVFIRHRHKARLYSIIGNFIFFLPWLFSTFRHRVLFLSNKVTN